MLECFFAKEPVKNVGSNFMKATRGNDLKYALKHADKVRIHIDSFSELHLLGKLTSKLKIKTEVGIRIHTPAHGLWTKYGIPLQSLRKFWEAPFFRAEKNKNPHPGAVAFG